MHLRQHAGRDLQLLQDFRIPAELPDIEQHRPGSIRAVGRMDHPAGHLPDQPGIDRAEEQIAGFRSGARARHMIQDPFDLGARKIGVRIQSGLLPDRLTEAVLHQFVDHFRGTAALPHDGVVHRLAGLPIPDDCGLTLVRNADGGNVAAVHIGFLHSLRGDRDLALPDFHRIVFDPAGLREDLRVFLLCKAQDVTFLVEDDAARAGRALVECH